MLNMFRMFKQWGRLSAMNESDQRAPKEISMIVEFNTDSKFTITSFEMLFSFSCPKCKKDVIHYTLEPHTKTLKFYVDWGLQESDPTKYNTVRFDMVHAKKKTFDILLYCPICGKPMTYAGVPYEWSFS